MDRRAFLSSSVVLASALSRPSATAQPPSEKQRAAILIGVNKPGGLPVLNAAASGAYSMAAWLAAEGFAVQVFADVSPDRPFRPVKVNDIFDAVKVLVDPGTLDQLVIYFAGHGFNSNYSEYWILSGAPDNPNEAVSLRESVELAHESGIPNVVFISDACRSTPQSLGTSRVRGSLIFPNRGVSRETRSAVDLFYASLVGDPAREVAVAESVRRFEGLYTSVFLDAFKHPDNGMVHTIEGVRVIPNNQLETFLDREVRKRSEANSLQFQAPDTIVVSGDKFYIAKVAGGVTASPESFSGPPKPTIAEVAGRELSRAGLNSFASASFWSEANVKLVADATGFSTAQAFVANSQPLQGDISAIPVRASVAVYGIAIDKVVVPRELAAKVLTPIDGVTRVAIDLGNRRACSVGLRFANGSGSVVAALRDFVASVDVDDRGVANVSYLPSNMGGFEPAEVKNLHATVSAAARYGVFRIAGDRDTRALSARELGDKIRVAKSIDPTLGLYAAYAYSDADLLPDIRSVQAIMHDNLGADLFDVAMLAGRIPDRALDDPLVPICPMLAQGWNYLRVKRTSIPPQVDAARDHLRPSLWTTFGPDGLPGVFAAVLAARW